MIDKLLHFLVRLPSRIEAPAADLLALFIRFYVGWQFFKAGQLKLQSWSSTISLFTNDYQVPLLPPGAAAVLGTAGEIVLPILLFVGLTTRLAALGLQIVNVVAMYAVLHFFDRGFADPAYADHWLWGLMLLMLMTYGGGRLSTDWLLERLTARPGK